MYGSWVDMSSQEAWTYFSRNLAELKSGMEESFEGNGFFGGGYPFLEKCVRNGWKKEFMDTYGAMKVFALREYD